MGKDVRVPYTEITSLQAKRIDSGETNIAVWVTVGVIVTAALLYAFSHLSPGINE